MGTYIHHAVIVTVPAHIHEDGRDSIGEAEMPDVEGFKASLPEPWRPLLVGPIPDVLNVTVTFVFGPDGSKEGWPQSDEGDEYRRRFADLFRFRYEDGSTPFDVVEVAYSDHAPPEVRDPRRSRTIRGRVVQAGQVLRAKAHKALGEA